MLTSFPERDMHRFKAVAVIGLSVAAAIMAMDPIFQHNQTFTWAL
jgi:hypothetical protein